MTDNPKGDIWNLLTLTQSMCCDDTKSQGLRDNLHFPLSKKKKKETY